MITQSHYEKDFFVVGFLPSFNLVSHQIKKKKQKKRKTVQLFEMVVHHGHTAVIAISLTLFLFQIDGENGRNQSTGLQLCTRNSKLPHGSKKNLNSYFVRKSIYTA